MAATTAHAAGARMSAGTWGPSEAAPRGVARPGKRTLARGGGRCRPLEVGRLVAGAGAWWRTAGVPV